MLAPDGIVKMRERPVAAFVPAKLPEVTTMNPASRTYESIKRPTRAPLMPRCKGRLRPIRGIAWIGMLALVPLALAGPLRPDQRQTLESLESQLLSNASATEVLESYCQRYFGAEHATVRAEILKRQDHAKASKTVLRTLKLGPGESVSYRSVRLRCGEIALSEADNWYVPERLTPAMNEALAKTDIPFGKVVKPLQFQRQTRKTRWNPNMTGASANPWIFENQAQLIAPGQPPFSVLRERYLASLLRRH